MEIVLGYIESLAFWRAQRIANNPISMSKNPVMRDTYAGVGNYECRVRTVASPHKSAPAISFAERSRIPLDAIKAYAASKLDALTLSEEYLLRAQTTRDYTMSSMRTYNMYQAGSCEHTGVAPLHRRAQSTWLSTSRVHAVRFSPDFSEDAPLGIIVPPKQRGLSQRAKQLTYVRGSLPQGSFYRLVITPAERARFDLPRSLTIYIASPELIVLLAAQKLRRLCKNQPCTVRGCTARTRGDLLFSHNIIGLIHELCGTFARDPLTATTASYNVKPLTSVQKIRRYVEKTRYVHGRRDLLRALNFCHDNIASMFENVVSSALMLPSRLGGINFPELEINHTRTLKASDALTPHHKSITPDLSSTRHKLAIECNGLAFHSSKDAIKEDHRRLRDYVSQGLRHVPLVVDDIKNPLVLAKTLSEIVATCHDTLGAYKTHYLRKTIQNSKYQPARQLMLDLQLS